MHEGDGLPGFPSVDVFIYLVTPQLERLRDPALELIQDSYSQLEQIAHSIVDKIFQPFFTTKPVEKGTGLGLSVSYFIITENHNGTLTIESEPGKGANFIIESMVNFISSTWSYRVLNRFS